MVENEFLCLVNHVLSKINPKFSTLEWSFAGDVEVDLMGLDMASNGCFEIYNVDQAIRFTHIILGLEQEPFLTEYDQDKGYSFCIRDIQSLLENPSFLKKIQDYIDRENIKVVQTVQTITLEDFKENISQKESENFLNMHPKRTYLLHTDKADKSVMISIRKNKFEIEHCELFKLPFSLPPFLEKMSKEDIIHTANMLTRRFKEYYIIQENPKSLKDTCNNVLTRNFGFLKHTFSQLPQHFREDLHRQEPSSKKMRLE